jgi:predicted HTH domain antitoxin
VETGKLILEIPDDLANAIRLPTEERTSRIRRELAVRLYQKGLLSFGKARQLAEMDKWEFHFLLAEEGVVRHYDLEELQQDLKTIELLSG